MIDIFMIVLNEEELVRYAMESVYLIREHVGVFSIVDNGSTDDTLDIIQEFNQSLNLDLQHIRNTPHHGNLRNAAISRCKSDYVFYLDADETWDVRMLDYIARGKYKGSDWVDFTKYNTVFDRDHCPPDKGPATRGFRNLPGTTFTQNVHTYPLNPSFKIKTHADVTMFDHTGCKSTEAMWAKGWRYQWAVGTLCIGRPNEYIWRMGNAIRDNAITILPDEVRKHVFTGPTK